MAHAHDHAGGNYNRAFAIGVTLNLAYVILEATYGVITESLALVADAGHNLSDVLGLLLAWGASWLVRRAPTLQRSYGWRRSSVLAAIANAVLLLIAIGAIALEAIRRFGNPEPVTGGTVIVVASIGIAVNTITALLFASGRRGDLNIRGAFLHLAADAAVSAGVVLAGIVIVITDWNWLDPAISLAIVVVIFIGTWGLLRDSVNMALDAVPDNIDPMAVQHYLEQLPGVINAHDLHIWSMSTTEPALTVHLVVGDGVETNRLLLAADTGLHSRFGIEHTTIQIETVAPGVDSGECRLAPIHRD
jgi:cobalt-zinc-cadmium efflux system protein